MRHLVPVAALISIVALPARAAIELYGVPPVQKLARDQAPDESWSPGRVELDCARNESESFQLVVRSDTPASDVAVRPAELRTQAGERLGPENIDVRRVEWVDVNAPYDPNTPSEHPDFRADPLPAVEPGNRFDLEPGRNLVFWLTVTVPESAAPGDYTGRVAVTAGGATAALEVGLHVRRFALPRRPILESMIGLSEGNIYRAHGCRTPEEKEQVIRLYFEQYIRARLSPFLYAPGTMAFSPLPDARIRWTFATDAEGRPTGEADLDLTGFDREATRYLDERDAFSAFNIAPYLWVRKEVEGRKTVVLRFADSTGKAVERLNPDGTVNPVFDTLVVTVFRGIAAHLAERGWLDRAVYYVTDEPYDDDVPALLEICRLIRRADPRLRTALTYDPANRPRLAELIEDRRSLISIWIPYCSLYRDAVAAEQRAKGADYWLYDVKDTCLITHSGTTNRAMLWDVWRRDAKGYLYYLSTWWGRDATPWDRPSFILPEFTYRYRCGDGYFFYPPERSYSPEPPILDRVVTTIRWELMREGVEDYDYLRLLEQRVAVVEQAGRAADTGRAALAEARALADRLAPAANAYGIRDFEFELRPGWSAGLEEGWLLHQGGVESSLPIRLATDLPDGRCALTLNVYDDTDYRGRAFSRFQVDGRPYATPGTGLKGPVDVACGEVEVRDGRCEFTLSSVVEGGGVIVYRARLTSTGAMGATDLYKVRRQVAEAIEGMGE